MCVMCEYGTDLPSLFFPSLKVVVDKGEMEYKNNLDLQNNNVPNDNEDTGKRKNYEKQTEYSSSSLILKMCYKLTAVRKAFCVSTLKEDIQQDLEEKEWNICPRSVDISGTTDKASSDSDEVIAVTCTQTEVWEYLPRRMKLTSPSTLEIFCGAMLRVTVVLCMMTTSSCEVDLVPRNPIYYEGHDAVFTCNAYGAVTVRWYYRQTLEPFIHAEFSDHLGVGILRINQISGLFNQTTLQCEAVYSNNVALSGTSSILIQGTPAPVSDLRYNFVSDGQAHIFWRAPFTLDVSDYAIDVTYCVDIINSSSMESMYTKCGISKTDHTCNSFPRLAACAEYLISVKAENPVGNSSAINMTAMNEGLEIVNFTQVRSTAISTRFVIAMNQSYCPIFVQLRTIDANIKYIVASTRLIEFELENNRHYKNITLEVSAPTYEYENLGPLKTYDVKDLEAAPVGNNSVLLQSSFFEYSSAQGVFCILLCVHNGSINLSRSSYLLISKADAENGVNVEGISSGVFLIMAYDIEWDGHLQHDGYPSTTQWINVTGSLVIDETETTTDLCNVTVNRLEIDVRCYCGASSYQVLLQNNDGSIDTVQNITTKKQSCSNSAVFHVIEFGVYYATAFHDADGGGVLNSTVIFSHEFLVEELSDSGPDSIVTDSNSYISHSSNNEAISETRAIGVIIGILISLVVIIMGVLMPLIAFKSYRGYKKDNEMGTSKELSENSYDVRKNSHDSATEANFMDSLPLQIIAEENCRPVPETNTSKGSSEMCTDQLDHSYRGYSNPSQPFFIKRSHSSHDIKELFDLGQGESKLAQSAPTVRGSCGGYMMCAGELHTIKVDCWGTRGERKVALTRGISEKILY